MRAIQSLPSTLASAEYDLLRYLLLRADTEVESAKFTHFFFSEIGPFLKKVPHLTDLKRRVVHVDAHFKGENAVVFEIRC